MGLPWVRLDTAFASNPKMLAVLAEKDGHRAAFVWLCGLAYSGAHGTDGFIPAEALSFVHARRQDVDRLVRHRLLVEQPGGWMINGWSDKQESNVETQDRRKRAQAAAQARWDKNGTRDAHQT